MVVYRNITKAVQSVRRRNKALHELSAELATLKQKQRCKDRNELQTAIHEIISMWKSYFIIYYPDDETVIDFTWEIDDDRVSDASVMDGTFVLYSTDERYSASEVVLMYMEKDVVEKAFCVMKSIEEIKPVRHRLESRVRAYVFVCMLAYRLRAALQWMITSSNSKKMKLSMSDFLSLLKRVERTEIDGGTEAEICYMNMRKDMTDQLVALGMKNLLVSERVHKE